MKKIIAFIILLAFAACNSHTLTNDSSPATKTDSSKAEVLYPYPIGYSSKFEFADPENSKMVLDLWKSYDNNTLDNVKDHFADTVEMIFPGFRMRAGRDSIIATAKTGRNMSNSVISTVDVVMSVKSTDKGGNWVLVWGNEMRTDKKNNTDTVAIHEVWGLNKDGKIEFMQQYASKK